MAKTQKESSLSSPEGKRGAFRTREEWATDGVASKKMKRKRNCDTV
jgi:hypothetical protein